MMVQITELPLGVSTNAYKEHLRDLARLDQIKGFSEHHTSNRVRFEVNAPETWIDEAEKVGFVKALKLSEIISTKNMHAFDPSGRIKLYDKAENIIEEHYHVRKQAYERRKQFMLVRLAKEARINSNKSRFISCILDGSLQLTGKEALSESKLVAWFQDNKFETLDDIHRACVAKYAADNNSAKSTTTGEIETSSTTEASMVTSDDGDSVVTGGSSKEFDYLTALPIHSVTNAKYSQLVAKAQQSNKDLEALLALSIEDMWIKEINTFVAKYQQDLAAER